MKINIGFNNLFLVFHAENRLWVNHEVLEQTLTIFCFSRKSKVKIEFINQPDKLTLFYILFNKFIYKFKIEYNNNNLKY